MTRKAIGIVRNIDPLGRIVIPKETMMKLNIANKDPMEFFVTEDSVIIKPFRKKCVICNAEEELSEYKEKLICNHCIQNVKKARPVY